MRFTPIHLRQSALLRAFTLVEMLTVLAIIVIVLLIIIPVWDTLVGNSAVANANNLIGATLGTARADALYNRQITGIVFFVDPNTNQTSMAEVQADGTATYNPHSVGSGPGVPASPGGPSAPTVAPENGAITPLEMLNYPQTTGGLTSFIYYREIVPLPAGVGVVFDSNTYGYSYALNTTFEPLDRYVHFGAILFDSTGKLISIPFGIPQVRPYTTSTAYTGASYTPGSSVNQLGLRLGLHPIAVPVTSSINTGDLVSIIPAPLTTHAPPSPPTKGFYPLTSSVGLLIYDRNAYLSQHCGNDQTNFGDDGKQFNEFDFTYALPNQPGWGTTPPPPAAAAADKSDEENWLDQNGTAFLVSPFNGELIKAKSQ
jgi:prepilin-type N-terminal cleavage/methylation domain-containing protein